MLVYLGLIITLDNWLSLYRDTPYKLLSEEVSFTTTKLLNKAFWSLNITSFGNSLFVIITFEKPLSNLDVIYPNVIIVILFWLWS